MKKKPIGIFDSGVGGLTVFKEVRKQFPFEDIVYFGDTARVPYGPKSKRTIIEYSLQNARFLIQQNVKLIIVACNTSSAQSIDVLEKSIGVPVIGVIKPGAMTAIKHSKECRIGVIGTEGTINSNAYQNEILKIKDKCDVYSQPCPLFVSLAEEGWESHKVAFEIAEEYLKDLKQRKIDTLVLGCTHYPILKNTIQKVMSESVSLVDSAEAIAEYLKENLPDPETSQVGKDLFYVSDNEEKFRKLASRILEKDIVSLERVKLGEVWFLD